jgi:ubiquitin carboxyl-terminal hydrolase 4/11/15
MKGEIAENYDVLVQSIFKPSASVYSPHPLKKTIGEFAPMFLGYSQQDSQELIAFLLGKTTLETSEEA